MHFTPHHTMFLIFPKAKFCKSEFNGTPQMSTFKIGIPLLQVKIGPIIRKVL